nr:class II lanthipeptide, LchA2/BrtA2 family [Bacillus pseudomycoides]
MNPETSPDSPTIVAVSIGICPTTKCTSKC